MSTRSVSASRVLPHAAEDIFAVLASPVGHVAIDGSGMVRGVLWGPDHLSLGSSFRMRMRFGVPYQMKSTVVEYEHDRRIAWAHLGRHRWRYDLEPEDDGTRVVETFDWSRAVSRRYIEAFRWPQRHEVAMTATLERLERVVGDRR